MSDIECTWDEGFKDVCSSYGRLPVWRESTSTSCPPTDAVATADAAVDLLLDVGWFPGNVALFDRQASRGTGPGDGAARSGGLLGDVLGRGGGLLRSRPRLQGTGAPV